MRDNSATIIADATLRHATKHRVSSLAGDQYDEHTPAIYHMSSYQDFGIDLDQILSKKISWLGLRDEA
jgi:hypothetical protein